MLCMAMYSLILCFQPEGTKHTFPVLKVKVRRKLLCTVVEKWRHSHFCNKASYIHQQFLLILFIPNFFFCWTTWSIHSHSNRGVLCHHVWSHLTTMWDLRLERLPYMMRHHHHASFRSAKGSHYTDTRLLWKYDINWSAHYK